MLRLDALLAAAQAGVARRVSSCSRISFPGALGLLIRGPGLAGQEAVITLPQWFANASQRERTRHARIPTFILVALLGAVACSAAAQSPSPYIGLEGRDLKAVAPERVQGLLACARHGLRADRRAQRPSWSDARAESLPSQLKLTSEQAQRTRAIMDSMKGGGRVLGAASSMQRRIRAHVPYAPYRSGPATRANGYNRGD